MSFSIRAIDLNNKKDLNSFIDLPWNIYKNDPHWVPILKMAQKDLLNQKKHPFYKTAEIQAYLAEKDGLVVGRIMAVHNYTYNKFENNQIGHFGFFEVIDNFEIAKALIDQASLYLKNKGLTSIMGPMNPGTNYECGLLVERFDDSPQIMMTYNPPYYENFLNQLGFKKTMDLLAYNYNPRIPLPKIIVDIAKRTESKSRITYRELNLKEWEKELDKMFDIYNSAWEDNWGFVPMSKEEFYHTAKDLKSIVDPSLVSFVLVDGVEAGFILILPDLNQVFKEIRSGRLTPLAIYKILTAKKRIKRARVITMGVKKEYRKMGLETLLYKNMQASLLKQPKLHDIEMSWILENNLEMNKALIRLAGNPYKVYRLLEKSL